MALTLNISSSEIDSDDITALTQNLCREISGETDVSASLPVTDGVEGAKGDVVTVGVIALAFISSGSAIALFKVLKAYLSREPSLELEFEDSNGLKVKVNSKNINTADVQKLIAQLQG